MNDSNPFSPPNTSSLPSYPNGPNKVSLDPIALYKRSYALIGDQYWLMFGITLVGILIGSAVPFGILLGPMMVGIYMCFADRERGQKVEFGTLFKGFDQFANSLIAVLIMVGISLVVMVPLMIMMVVGMMVLMPNNGGQGGALAIPFLLFFYLILFLVVFFVQLPFMFAFQLIAERKLTGPQAVSLSFQGVKTNLVGCMILAFVIAVFSVLASLACYVPVFFLMPLTFGVLFLAYRDIFGPALT